MVKIPDTLTLEEVATVQTAAREARHFIRASDAYQLRVIILKLAAAIDGTTPDIPRASDDAREDDSASAD